ncbi:MAG: DUF4249 domain-containing protein [Bacteroidia bacterium]
MEFQVLIKYIKILLVVGIAATVLGSCEKEINVSLPGAKQDWVVEASINQRFFTLNYVYISQTLDYFKPDLSLNGVRGAKVYVTEGEIFGTDTVFNIAKRDSFINFFDSILPGIYVNPGFMGKVGKPYKLEIIMPNGDYITGQTFIRQPPVIDSISYNIIDTNAFVYFQWKDGPGQDNYRIALWDFPDSLLTGWGAADRFYTLDDNFFDNMTRPFQIFNPFKVGDTLNIYLSAIGRQEYLFWESFRRAAGNGGPFATPINVRSNIKGAIGSFTGYGVEFKQVIFK